MEYNENYHGILYHAKRGQDLTIKAPICDFYLSCVNGILHIMNKGLCGRTAVFVNDCDFFHTDNHIVVTVKIGTASYMKELNKVRKVSDFEYKTHNLELLW